MQDVPSFLFRHRRRVRQAQDQPLHDVAAKLDPDQLPGFHRKMTGNAIGKRLGRRDPVSVDGDVGVVHDETSLSTSSVEIRVSRSEFQCKTAATAPGKAAGGGWRFGYVAYRLVR